MKTMLCERLGIELPIIQAAMAGAVGPAAVAWTDRSVSILHTWA